MKILAVGGLLAAAVYSQSGVGSEPSPMEAFAKEPGVQTVWSAEIGRLENHGTVAVITALVLEDGSQPARKVRGVKIGLSGPDRDQIYLDEPATERTRAALEEIAQAVARSGNRGPSSCMGAREFWPRYNWPWNPYHELNADWCGSGDNATFVLRARGRNVAFRFPGERPAHLAALLAGAVEQMKDR